MSDKMNKDSAIFIPDWFKEVLRDTVLDYTPKLDAFCGGFFKMTDKNGKVLPDYAIESKIVGGYIDGRTGEKLQGFELKE